MSFDMFGKVWPLFFQKHFLKKNLVETENLGASQNKYILETHCNT